MDAELKRTEIDSAPCCISPYTFAHSVALFESFPISPSETGDQRKSPPYQDLNLQIRILQFSINLFGCVDIIRVKRTTLFFPYITQKPMIKLIHLIFIFSSFISFTSRIGLSVFKPSLLQNKFIKIAPHVIDTILLLSGITLVIQGNWLAGEFGWIVSKFILLLAYIGLGVMAMRFSGVKRWVAFAAAVVCFISIFIIAITKNGFF